MIFESNRGLSTAIVACAIVLATACRARRASESQSELVVFAAASLRDAFTRIGTEFERKREPLDLTFNFAGTQELRTQLEHGAPADVFASADQRHMAELLAAGRVLEPYVFASNEPVVVLRPEQAATLRSFADLPSAKRIVIGTPEVPIGRYTLAILDRASERLGVDFKARVEANVVSRELSVRQVLARVSLGEADAGIVYRTDAITARARVHVLRIPADINVIAEYPIAMVARTQNRELAQAWLETVRSTAAQEALQGAGFLSPRAPPP